MGLACVLAERGDPAAVSSAAAAIDIARSYGSPERLTTALPTAATVCWQVGAYERARAYVAEAMPPQPAPRIATVVLACVAAALALLDGDPAAGVELGRTADAQGTALGVGRELPLVRSVLARALLASGRIEEARAQAGAALESALSLTIDAPLAVAIETAVTVAEAGPETVNSSWSDQGDALLASAAEIRRRGLRPVPPGLMVRSVRPGAAALAPREAARRALELVGPTASR